MLICIVTKEYYRIGKDDMMNLFLDYLNYINIIMIIILISLSTIILVAEAIGFLPTKVSRFFFRNRICLVLDFLKELGIDVNKPLNTLIFAF